MPIFLRERKTRHNKRKTPRSLATGTPGSTLDDPPSESAGPARPSSPTPSTSSTQTSNTTSFTAYSVGSSAAPRTRAEHDFLLFTYLLRFVHREGKVGDFAREALLHLVDIATSLPTSPPPSLAASQHVPTGMTRSDTNSTITAAVPTPSRASREATLAFAEHLLDSDFAEVLGAGLGALYGLLPNKLVVRGLDASAPPTGWTDGGSGMLGGGGMVLGGMGALGENADQEELEQQREDEEDKLRSLGYGITGTDEFRDSIDGWLTLVEFTQEVLMRCKVAEDVLGSGGGEEDQDDVDDEAREQQFVMSALSASILGSLRSSLLENVLCKSCRVGLYLLVGEVANICFGWAQTLRFWNAPRLTARRWRCSRTWKRCSTSSMRAPPSSIPSSVF